MKRTGKTIISGSFLLHFFPVTIIIVASVTEYGGVSMIITIGREYGSGGREIGRKIAEKLNIPFYDKEILNRAA